MDKKQAEWLYDYIFEFLHSPSWRLPILEFIDNNCHYFSTEEENKLEYTTIFNSFKERIDNLLNNLCSELGVSDEEFAEVYEQGLENPDHRKVFEQILACDNFSSFKKMMIKRNTELELEAISMLKRRGIATKEEKEHAVNLKEKADIKYAIELSRTVREIELKKTSPEETLLQKALRESEMEFKRENEYRNKEKERKKQKEVEYILENEENVKIKTEEIDEVKTSTKIELGVIDEDEKRIKLKEEKERIRAVEEARAERERLKLEKKEGKINLIEERAENQIEEAKNKEKLEKITNNRKKATEMEEEKNLCTENEIEKIAKEEEEIEGFNKIEKKKESKFEKERETKRKLDEAELETTEEGVLETLESPYIKEKVKPQINTNLADLPPIQHRKQPSSNYSEIPQIEEFVQQSPVKSLKKGTTEIRNTETLQERQQRLIKQRELLQAKLNKNREAEMKVYMDNGGVDLMKKPVQPLPELLSDSELEKRKSIIEKLKSIDL